MPLAIKSEPPVELPNKWQQHYTNEQLKEAQTKDTNLQKLVTWISDDRKPEQSASNDQGLLVLLLTITDGLLILVKN